MAMAIARKMTAAAVAAIMVLALGLMAGCSGSGAGPKALSAEGSFEIEGGSVQLDEGVLTVSLDAQPSTGYTWMMTIDGDSVEMRSDNFTPDITDGNEDPAAAKGTQDFVFVGMEPGQSTIKLEYKEPWNEQADPQQTVILDATADAEDAITDVTMVE